jgi:septum formation protein
MSSATAIPRVVLASASPRRLELLRAVGLDPEVRSADIDETVLPGEGPIAHAERLAQQKTRTVAAALTDARPILGADTIVYLDDNDAAIFGKPPSAPAAREILQRLSGRTHQVVTAYRVRYRGAEHGRAVQTAVTFRRLSATEIDHYLDSREWQGKAGGYAVQGIAAAFVEKVHGSYSNIVGLPLCEVLVDLDAIGALPPDWARGRTAS